MASAFNCIWNRATIFTLIYFIPRLKIMGIMDDQPSMHLELLTVTIKQWVSADYWRFWILIVPAFFFGLKAVTIPLTEDRPKSIL